MNLKKSLLFIANFLKIDLIIFGFLHKKKYKPAFSDFQKLESRVFDNFVTKYSESIELYEGLRRQIKPGWEAMFQDPQFTPPSKISLKSRQSEWDFRIQEPLRILSNHALNIKGKSVIEIGANDGATAIALAKNGADSIIATDVTSYYLNQKGEAQNNLTSLKNEQSLLTLKREAMRNASDTNTYKRIKYIEDDICASKIESESSDVIMSWEVIEHLSSPKNAFNHMYRILKPGGMAFHEYNPFFALDGGHSLCTLDFPWGHARLSSDDFDRYITKYRSNEKEMALSFFYKNLNRLSLKDVTSCSIEAGFEMTALIPWSKRSHLEKIDSEILRQVTRQYPSVTMADLISPRVWLFLTKPT